MNIKNFLSGGETTLYTRMTGRLLSIAGPMVITLTLGALTGCSTSTFASDQSFDMGGPMAQQAQAHTTGASGYTMDGPTVLYQAMVDPTMQRVTVASSTSQFLGQFVASQPAAVVLRQGNSLRSANANELADILNKNTQAGLSTAITNVGTGAQRGPSACLVLTRGLGSGYTVSDLQQELMRNPDTLNMSSLDRSMAYVAIHESAHCLPFEMMAEPIADGGLEYAYFASLRELRSDLAVVLYTAMQTGSFEDGMVMVGAMRGVVSADMTHSDFEMLKLVVGTLNAHDFKGRSVYELSAESDQVLASLHPATNKALRLAFAREALTNVAIFSQVSPSAAQKAKLDFAAFAGGSFTVDLRAHARETIDLALDNALRSVDAVRASGLMTGAQVQAYSRFIGGGDLTPDQVEKAMFLDGAQTQAGLTVSRSGRVAAKVSSLDMDGLLKAVGADISGMIAAGSIQAGPIAPAARQDTPSDPSQTLGGRLRLGVEAMDKAMDRSKEVALKVIHVGSPRM